MCYPSYHVIRVACRQVVLCPRPPLSSSVAPADLDLLTSLAPCSMNLSAVFMKPKKAFASAATTEVEIDAETLRELGVGGGGGGGGDGAPMLGFGDGGSALAPGIESAGTGMDDGIGGLGALMDEAPPAAPAAPAAAPPLDPFAMGGSDIFGGGPTKNKVLDASQTRGLEVWAALNTVASTYDLTFSNVNAMGAVSGFMIQFNANPLGMRSVSAAIDAEKVERGASIDVAVPVAFDAPKVRTHRSPTRSLADLHARKILPSTGDRY